MVHDDRFHRSVLQHFPADVLFARYEHISEIYTYSKIHMIIRLQVSAASPGPPHFLHSFLAYSSGEPDELSAAETANNRRGNGGDGQGRAKNVPHGEARDPYVHLQVHTAR